MLMAWSTHQVACVKGGLVGWVLAAVDGQHLCHHAHIPQLHHTIGISRHQAAAIVGEAHAVAAVAVAVEC